MQACTRRRYIDDVTLRLRCQPLREECRLKSPDIHFLLLYAHISLQVNIICHRAVFAGIDTGRSGRQRPVADGIVHIYPGGGSRSGKSGIAEAGAVILGIQGNAATVSALHSTALGNKQSRFIQLVVIAAYLVAPHDGVVGFHPSSCAVKI